MFEFLMLGPLEVRVGSRVVPISSPLQRALLVRLLLDPGVVVSVDRLVEDLWSDDVPASPTNALRYHIWQLRDTLEPNRPGRSEGRFIRTKAPGYCFDAAEAMIDVVEFARLASEGHTMIDRDPGRARELLTTALGLWRGEALADVAYREFAQGAARLLIERRLVAVEDRIGADLACGAGSELVAELEELVHQHPWRERLRGQLMVALYRSGRQVEALAAFRQAREVLGEELGIDPSPELRAIETQVLVQDAELDVPGRQPASNLPTPLTSFIGREAQLSEIATLLTHHRLVTLLGAPGVGKTRLAIEAATRLAPSVHHWITWIDLVPVRDRDDLIGAVADALGIPTPGQNDPLQVRESKETSIVRSLLRRPWLLIMDNCEHVVDPVANVTRQLLESSLGTSILATSRRPLGIASEIVIEVRPLETVGHLGPGKAAWGSVVSSEAGALFLDRATAAGASMPKSPTSARDIAELCRRLDGLPLAIELAAARARSMAPADLLRHLDRRFLLLDESNRHVPTMRTLWGALEWSYGLLTAEEAAAFRCLSVFTGGFDLEAGEAVVGAFLEGETPPYNLITRLVDHSLLVSDMGGDMRRFHMLESAREFALRKLRERQEQDAAYQALCNYLSELGEEAWEARRDPSRRAGLRLRLDAFQQDLAMVVDRLLTAGDACAAMRVIGALGDHWSRGLVGKFAAAFRSVGETCTEANARLRARFLYSWSLAEEWAGNQERAGDLADRAFHLAESAGELSLAVDALVMSAFSVAWRAEVEKRFMKALSLCREAGDPVGEAIVLAERGMAEVWNGDFAIAHRHLETAAAAFEQEGDEEALSHVLRWVTWSSRCVGDLSAARSAAQRGRALVADGAVSGAGDVAAWLTVELAQVEMDAGNPEVAGALLSETITVFGDIPWADATMHCLLGWALRASGHGRDALDHMIAAIRIRLRSPEEEARRQSGIAWLLESVAGLCAEVYDPEMAARLFGAAEMIRRRVRIAMPAWDMLRYERDLVLLRERLSAEGIREAWEQGRELTLEAAVQLVFSELSPLLID
jgi:predicted ATPase/DNA-binding SARP family transcriptional activator